MYEATAAMVASARSGAGPGFLMCNTYRYHGHHVGDVDRAYYRSGDEEQAWRSQRDPIELLESRLLDEGVSQEQLDEVREDVRGRVETGLAFALDTPVPRPPGGRRGCLRLARRSPPPPGS